MAALLAWDDGSAASHVADRLVADARFAPAGHRLVSNMLVAAANDPCINGLIRDAGRYIGALWSMLTLPRLKALCAQTGYVSAGRARLLLIYLRYLKCIEPVGAPVPGEAARHQPTTSFLQSWHAHLRSALDAARMIEPAIGLILEKFEDPDVLETFARMQSGGWLSSDSGMRDDDPFFRTFVHRNGGTQLLLTVMASDAPHFPPVAPLHLPLTGLARCFGVSRMQLRRMLDQAIAEKLMLPQPDGCLLLADGMRMTLARFYAVQLVELLRAAARTVRALPHLNDQRAPSA
ncbi:MAG TPA: hypothetical protein VGM26_00695 [Rhizomicrobium sp.]|jgi:hypothetical protein